MGKIMSSVIPVCGHRCREYSTHHYSGGEYNNYCMVMDKNIIHYEMSDGKFPDWCPLEDEGRKE